MPDQNSSTDATAAPEIERLGLHLPEFNNSDPELWFAMADNAFEAACITTETTKFNHTVSHLGSLYGSEVRDLILNRPSINPYSVLKTELIKRIGMSQATKTKRLLEHEVIGDLKPSQFMRRLKSLGGISIADDVIRTIWLSRLPKFIQAILSTHLDLTLDKLSEIADTIADTTSSEPHVILPVEKNNPSQNLENIIASKFSQLQQQFEKQLSKLQEEINGTQTEQIENFGRTSRKFFTRRRSQSRPRSTSRNRNSDPPLSGICWYHWRFGTNSTKCKQPCSFVKKPEN